MSGEMAVTLREHDTSVMERGTMSSSAVVAHVEKVHEIMEKILKNGEHYGTIPGTNKPTLLKPGAEKLSFAFRLLPKFRVTMRDLPNNHREYELVCELWHESGVFAGEGVGSCSTMESKYRYRNVADYEITGDPIPEDAKQNKKEYRRQGYGMKQVNGVWEWVKYKDAARQENPDIADTYNTVLKMAKKRALIDATITACAASDIFTQDVEDLQNENETPQREPTAAEHLRRIKEETPTAPKEEDPDNPLVQRRNMEKEIGDMAKMFGADAVSAARETVRNLRDMVETEAITWDVYMEKLKKFRDELKAKPVELPL